MRKWEKTEVGNLKLGSVNAEVGPAVVPEGRNYGVVRKWKAEKIRWYINSETLNTDSKKILVALLLITL